MREMTPRMTQAQPDNSALLEPGETERIFEDPIGYLAGFGLAAEVVSVGGTLQRAA